MSGYSSNLNLRIGQMPEIKDNPAIFSELQRIYNALHLLNASMDNLRDRATDRDTPPWESFSWEGRSFWAPAANNVGQGDLVKLEGSQWIPGIRGRSDESEGFGLTCSGGRAWLDTTANAQAFDFGFCVEGTEDGLAHIAWPPFIVELEGVGVGELAYGKTNDGRIFSNSPTGSFFPVGIVVAPNALLLQHNMHVQAAGRKYVSFNQHCGS